MMEFDEGDFIFYDTSRDEHLIIVSYDIRWVRHLRLVNGGYSFDYEGVNILINLIKIINESDNYIATDELCSDYGPLFVNIAKNMISIGLEYICVIPIVYDALGNIAYSYDAAECLDGIL